jgi:hypothetical protein
MTNILRGGEGAENVLSACFLILLREESDFTLVTQYLTSIEAITDAEFLVPLQEKNR